MTTTNINVQYSDAVLWYLALPLIHTVHIDNCVAHAKTLKKLKCSGQFVNWKCLSRAIIHNLTSVIKFSVTSYAAVNSNNFLPIFQQGIKINHGPWVV
jgi:hypothetical protein